MTIAAIMTSPDFGEVCFLIALILFAVAFVVQLVASTASTYAGAITSAGLASLALGFLAL